MKIQAINSVMPKTNTKASSKNVTFGWFGGPMEPNVLKKKSFFKECILNIEALVSCIKEDAKKVFSKK